ncbi:homoserine dehydrogenase [Alicyclobacillus sp. SO9]|uniref:homoserine dehydrogenase n=1 Tax=Alicyclobacillus sp. SO9 TaxID=2665646 RepID=UPI001E4984FB|nr:homoserine dehydrogenase [Alicyclobacillus sp. SO9]
MKPIRIGLLGCGVVGTGVVRVLQQNRERIEAVFGRPVEIEKIAVADLTRPRMSFVPVAKLCDDWKRVCTDDNIDVIIEVMGGQTAAKDAVSVALQHGKHVVTANKELLSTQGGALYELARSRNVRLECEASVLGGIPALHTLETYFRVNQIRKLRGIVNGTSNYILTKMHADGTEFAEALAEAQELGYAEPDATMDIEGLDASFKLQILAKYVSKTVTIAEFKAQPSGISQVTQQDIQQALAQGKRIKHVVSAEFAADGCITSMHVGPQLLSSDDVLYHVNGVQNALELSGDIVGDILLSGPGAGALPTASAIVEDLAKVYPTHLRCLGNSSVMSVGSR